MCCPLILPRDFLCLQQCTLWSRVPSCSPPTLLTYLLPTLSRIECRPVNTPPETDNGARRDAGPARPALCFLLGLAACVASASRAISLLLDAPRLRPARRPHHPAQARSPSHVAPETVRRTARPQASRRRHSFGPIAMGLNMAAQNRQSRLGPVSEAPRTLTPARLRADLPLISR